MPLAHGEKLSTYRIQALPSSHLLKVLGFRKGTQFTIQSKQPFKGPIVVKVGNRSIAIDYDIANEILVEEVVQN
ncbi:MAG: FeoA family protein [Caldicoprobacterales bacterium]|jgi:ferrous iron transport protein A|nr:ferrous iron transport protein A [Clostridiales bacterium]